MSDSSDVASLAVSVVALVVAFVALTGTMAQVVQQYLATAIGYSNCGERVMGSWARYTELKFRPWQLRFEVIFKAPVLFVTPIRELGVGPGENMCYVDGSDQAAEFLKLDKAKKTNERQQGSEHDEDSDFDGRNDTSAITRFRRQTRFEKKTQDAVSAEARPPTFAYSASWLALLEALQDVRRESRLEYELHIPRGMNGMMTFEEQMRVEIQPMEQRKLSWVVVQKAPYSLDLMPDGIKKPFALTTLGDLILIAATLGVHWKQFNLRDDKYLAAGNGYLFTGTSIPHLGLMFTFQQQSTYFPRHRLIPSVGATPYCFGFAPMLFSSRTSTNTRPRYSADLLDDPTVMNLWSKNKIAETLKSLGCNKNSSQYFQVDGGGITDHIFPVAFEILGMLAEVVHQKGLSFRMLPNPTPYRWNRESFSLRSLLASFLDIVEDLDNPGFKTERTRPIFGVMLRIIHSRDSYDDLMRESTSERAETTRGNLFDTLLHEAVERCTQFLRHSVLQKIVFLAFRNHINVILELINKDDGNGAEVAGLQPIHQNVLGQAPLRGQREKHLMGLYANVVAKLVVARSVTHLRGRMQPQPADGTDKSVPEVALGEESRLEGEGSGEEREIDELKIKVAEVWVVMVLRMICWLWLHDFDRDDVQIPKSDLFGSKQPVYIS
ncbi:hypothetical protein FDECE_4067 [Fusarium decemcellulare]|nr:hypothetical protein FDECE_4067 [Fusarium decemcellulare]